VAEKKRTISHDRTVSAAGVPAVAVVFANGESAASLTLINPNLLIQIEVADGPAGVGRFFSFLDSFLKFLF
jgi:hypothetical protein